MCVSLYLSAYLAGRAARGLTLCHSPIHSVESELLASRMREGEMSKQLEEARKVVAAREKDLRTRPGRVTGEALFFRLPRRLFTAILSYLTVRCCVQSRRLAGLSAVSSLLSLFFP